MRRKTLRKISMLGAALFMLWCAAIAAAEWRTAWVAAAQGPYPTGFAQGQPDLSLAFPDPEKGAVDQTFRMIVMPDIWGERVRIRFTNVFGSKPVTIDGAFVGLSQNSAAVVRGTNRPIRFKSDVKLTLQPGESAWSDSVYLPFVRDLGTSNLFGRKLAVSFHVVGESGPMTWHALASTTSYLSWPGAGSVGEETSEKHFPFGAVSWFLIDAVDMTAERGTQVVVCFGDSITDGHMSSHNGDDNWPASLSRIAKTTRGNGVSILNSGICGNQITGPAGYAWNTPDGGGPSAFERLERDVLSLSGVSAIIWLEGINDLHTGGKTAAEVAEGMRKVVGAIRAKRPGIRIVGATLVSSLGSTLLNYGEEGLDAKRRELNEFIRTGGLFDAVIDFDAALLDADTGKIRAEYAPDSFLGGPGDYLHPNRAGYLKMAETVDLDAILAR